MKFISLPCVLALSLCACAGVFAQATSQTSGGLKGKVTLEDQPVPVHNVIIILTQLKLTTLTDEQGAYEFKDVPPGTYNLVARLDRIPDVVQRVEIKSGQTVELDIQLKLSGVREQVTVTASGDAQTALESFQGVTGLDATSLTERATSSLGEALEGQTGIAKRSSGPGSARPVIRGFDGNRVLIAQDGVGTGSLSYSSGDHGEPLNVLTVERVEVVRGPATLLYGSSAIGGMVNAVSGHEQPHEGLHGFVTGTGGSNNNQAGASAGLEYGNTRWLVWGNGGGLHTDEYHSPLGAVLNSQTHNWDITGGAGYFGKRGFFTASYSVNRSKFGVPYDRKNPDAEIVSLNPQRQDLRLNGGLSNLTGFFDHVHLTFDYSDYKHQELVEDTPQTQFFNKTYSYRALAEQKRQGKYSGTFGSSGFHRDYKVLGDEALVPPTTQDSFSLFGLQGIDLKRVAFQFGGRLERNAYDTVTSATRRNRDFTGFSGSAGVRVPLWDGAAFSGNYTHSYRAPSLDELYNKGPHPGNATFEIGNTNLQREAGDGLEFSLRHAKHNIRTEAHYFYYSLRDFIFLAPTGAILEALPVAEYHQGNSRYTGAEFDFSANLNKYLTLNTGLDYVNAKLAQLDKPLPRIPPLHARLGLEINYKNFRFAPEVSAVRPQTRLFTNETRTAGYALVNFTGGYTFAQKHAAHILSINGFNLNNKEYYNHLSFLKAFTPEIGRGVRATYTVRFF